MEKLGLERESGVPKLPAHRVLRRARPQLREGHRPRLGSVSAPPAGSHSHGQLTGDGESVAPLQGPVLQPLSACNGPGWLLRGDPVPGGRQDQGSRSLQPITLQGVMDSARRAQGTGASHPAAPRHPENATESLASSPDAPSQVLHALLCPFPLPPHHTSVPTCLYTCACTALGPRSLRSTSLFQPPLPPKSSYPDSPHPSHSLTPELKGH